MNFYYVYVIQSEKDFHNYIGFSSDVFKRLNNHNCGRNVSTKKRKPFKLIYFEAHLSAVDARRRENYLKTNIERLS